MGKSIIRWNSIGTMQEMNGAYAHNYREYDVPNADPELAHLNEELVRTFHGTYKEAWYEHVKSFPDTIQVDENGKIYQHGKKLRKDAVLAIDVVVGFSKEDMGKINIETWKNEQVKWLDQQFSSGIKNAPSNVLSVMFHGDEAGGVHCHALIVPIDDKGHLNAHAFIGGRTACIKIQDEYGKAMNKAFGLERGTAGSMAKHQDMKMFYAAVNSARGKEMPEPLPNEDVQKYKERCDAYIKDVSSVYEQKLIDAKAEKAELMTAHRNEMKELKREMTSSKKKVAVLEDMEREFGSAPVMKQKLELLTELNTGAKTYYDDVDKTNELLAQMNDIARHGRKVLEKEKAIKKTKLDKIAEQE